MEFDQIRAIAIEEMDVMDYESVLTARQDYDDLIIYFPTDKTDLH